MVNFLRRIRNYRHSLGLKILAWSFVPTFIIVTAVALVNFFAYQQVTETLVLERDGNLVRLAAGQLATDLESHTRLLTAVAPTLAGQSLAQQRTTLQEAANWLALFDGGVLLLDRQGQIVATLPDRPDMIGRERQHFDYFEEPRRSGQPYFSTITQVGDSLMVAIAVPVVDGNGRFHGVLVGLFRLGDDASNALYNSIIRLHSSEHGSTYLVDSNGTAIFHTMPHRIGQHLGARTAVRALLRGEAGAIRTYEFFDVELIAAFAPVPGTSWGLAVEESWDVLFQASQGYRQLLLLLLALGLVLPALVVTAGVRHITRPIADLIAGATAVAAGDFEQVVAAKTGDELEELADQFNHMAAQLQASYAHLEQRVADRTHELATLNLVATSVHQSLEPQAILQTALELTASAVEAPTALACYLDQEGEKWQPLARLGLPAELMAGELPLTAVSPAVTSGSQPTPLATADLPDTTWATAWAMAGVSQLLLVPLRAKGQTLGLLLLGWPAPPPLRQEEYRLLAAVSQQVGVALENALLYRQAEQLAAVEERQRLARDLHDSVAQALYSMALFTGAASRLLAAGDTATTADYLAQIQETTQEALQEMRLLIFELRPPILAESGLAAALQARLEAVEGRAGLQTELVVAGNGRLPAPIEDALYRVAQEALNNALKHAQAQTLQVTLHWDEQQARLEIRDNGRGFDAKQVGSGGLGLGGIAERVAQLDGQFSLHSQPGEGTAVIVTVNLSK
jgi:signal transduction histidine kinase